MAAGEEHEAWAVPGELTDGTAWPALGFVWESARWAHAPFPPSPRAISILSFRAGGQAWGSAAVTGKLPAAAPCPGPRGPAARTPARAASDLPRPPVSALRKPGPRLRFRPSGVSPGPRTPRKQVPPVCGRLFRRPRQTHGPVCSESAVFQRSKGDRTCPPGVARATRSAVEGVTQQRVPGSGLQSRGRAAVKSSVQTDK